jgi:hypothetical protein
MADLGRRPLLSIGSTDSAMLGICTRPCARQPPPSGIQPSFLTSTRTSGRVAVSCDTSPDADAVDAFTSAVDATREHTSDADP